MPVVSHAPALMSTDTTSYVDADPGESPMPVKATEPHAPTRPPMSRAGSAAMLALLVVAAATPAGAVGETVRDAVGTIAAATATWSSRGLERAPVLMAALGTAVALPVLAGMMMLREALRRRRALAEAARAAFGLDAPASALEEAVWAVRRTGAEGAEAVIDGEMIRVGRHDENDLVLDHPTVHRHHALLCRTEDDGLAVFDLTGGAGNGIAVNGVATARAALAAGDRLTLGAVTLAVCRLPRGQRSGIRDEARSAASSGDGRRAQV